MTSDPCDASANQIDRVTDRLMALEGTLTAAACGITPLGDDGDAELLELLYGLLRARAEIRTTLDRVAARGSGQ